MPTLALTNSICFRHMNRPDLQFPGIRVLGTIGWIVIGLVVSFGFNEVSNQPFLVASAVSLAMGIFCLFLPHTPPSPPKEGDLWPPLKALGMLRDPGFATFIVVSFAITIVLTFYYQLTHPFLEALNAPRPQALQTSGQVAEMILLPFLPWFVKRLGIRWTLAMGMAAWCLRYGIFATQSLWPIILIGLPLHGVCYDFFFVVSQIYVDQSAPRDVRASAQGLLAFVTLGVGMFLGNVFAGYTQAFATDASGVTNYTLLWIVPCIGSGLAIVAFLIGFREPDARTRESELAGAVEVPA
jgi:nucleoside transporter